MLSMGRLVDAGIGWRASVGEGRGACEMRVGDAGGEERGEPPLLPDGCGSSASAATVASMST